MKITSIKEQIKSQKLFSCEHIMSCTVTFGDGSSNWHTADHQLWIFRAGSLREATAKAHAIVEAESDVYKNDYGEDVTWQLDGKQKIRRLAKDSELDFGIEVRSEMREHPKFDPLEYEKHPLPGSPPPSE